MARKPRRIAVDYAVYLAVRMLVCAIQALPGRLPFQVADWLGWLAYRVDKRHRAVAAENLRFAFPELANRPDRIDRLVRDSYRHIALVAIEIALLPRKLHVTSWRRYASLHLALDFVAPLYSPRAALFVTGHFGNWEVAGWMMGLFGFKTFAIARVLDNPFLERYLKRFRQATKSFHIFISDRPTPIAGPSGGA